MAHFKDSKITTTCNNILIRVHVLVLIYKDAYLVMHGTCTVTCMICGTVWTWSICMYLIILINEHLKTCQYRNIFIYIQAANEMACFQANAEQMDKGPP